MLSRAICVLLALGVLATPTSSLAKPTTTPAAATYTFAFKDAAIGQVAEEILGKALGLNYSVDPAVTGTLSFQIDRRLTSAQLLEAFEAALKADGIVMVRQGDSLLLEPRAKAKGAGSLANFGDGAAHGVGYQTLAVPLTYATPSEVAKALEAVAPEGTVVYVDDKQGLLMLGGDPQELQAAVRMVRTFDHSGLEGSKVRFFALNQAPADTVAADLDKVLKASGEAGVTAVPLLRLNGLFVFARTDKGLDDVGEWVVRLDVPPKEINETFYSYHPHNVSAEELAGSVTGVLTGRPPPAVPTTQSSQIARSSFSNGGGNSSFGGGGNYGSTLGLQGGGGSSSFGGVTQPQFQAQSQMPANNGGALVAGEAGGDAPGGVRIGFDRGSNTVLVMAPAGRWVQVQKMLEELDRAPAQVMIEASILEVTLSGQTSGGIDWSFAGTGAGGIVTASSLNNGGVGASSSGFSATFAGKNIQAAIHALGSKGDVEVISNPKIIAIDNQTAHLEVGDQVPIVTQSGQGTITVGSPVINSVDYRNTGVILNVTPRISGDKIHLDIDQEVSSAIPNTTSGINSPTIQQRTLQTSLILDNGAMAAIGGLMNNTRSINDSGMPYLKDIPILGYFFKSASKTTGRTELVVLITAKIITDQASSSRVMADLLADMVEIERRGLVKRGVGK